MQQTGRIIEASSIVKDTTSVNFDSVDIAIRLEQILAKPNGSWRCDITTWYR